MIQETTKEQPLELDVKEGLIAFIGNINDCSNYAGRFAKTNRSFDWSNGLSKKIDLIKPLIPTGLMYYLGEIFNNSLPSIIRSDTKLIVIVDDHIDRLNATMQLLDRIAVGVPVQVLQAKKSLGVTNEQLLLNDSDKLVIRELERLFLKGSPLNIEREQLRVDVDTDVYFIPDEEPIMYEHLVLSMKDIAALSSDQPINTARLIE
jgi:hypothetical protein